MLHTSGQHPLPRSEVPLRDYLTPTQLNIYQRFLLCIAIAKQVKQMHDIQRVHAHIHPDNILVTSTLGSGEIIFTTTLLPRGHQGYLSQMLIPPFSGLTSYLSPEVQLSQLRRQPVEASRKFDIFSLGILFAEIFSLNFNVREVETQENIKLEIRTVDPFSELTMNGFLQQPLIQFLNTQLLCLWDQRIAIDVLLTELKRLKDSIPASERCAPIVPLPSVPGAAAEAFLPPPAYEETLLPQPASSAGFVSIAEFNAQLYADPRFAARMAGMHNTPATPVPPLLRPVQPPKPAGFFKNLFGKK